MCKGMRVHTIYIQMRKIYSGQKKRMDIKKGLNAQNQAFKPIKENAKR
jgi:hypothetical protein